MNRVISFLKKPEIKYILILFVATRIILSLIGFSSRLMLESFNVNSNHFQYSTNPILAVWGVWDSGYYLDIAKNGYSADLGQGIMTKGQANYAFFPLYPALIKLFSYLFGSFYLAGLFISNICLLLSAYVLYKLVKLDYGPETALGSVKYLFLFPTAFILSGLFSESLFLLLLLLAFYYARRKNWLAANLSGFFLVLCRPLGILMIFPIVYEYFKSREFKFKKINYQLTYFVFWFFALILFLIYVNSLTGNPLNYFKTQSAGFGHVSSNPLGIILQGLLSKDIFRLLGALIPTSFAIILIFKAREIRLSYLFAAVLLFIFPLTTGLVSLNSMLRYILPIFPIFVALALMSKDKTRAEIIMISLALLQGFLMVFWTNGLHLIV